MYYYGGCKFMYVCGMSWYEKLFWSKSKLDDLDLAPFMKNVYISVYDRNLEALLFMKMRSTDIKEIQISEEKSSISI